MKHIENYKLFLESKKEELNIHKYDIVKFNENIIIRGVVGPENLIVNLKVKKGEYLKLYFDKARTNENVIFIKGFRPIKANESMVGKKVKAGGVLEIKDLWSANFVLNSPISFNMKKLPFEIKDYFI